MLRHRLGDDWRSGRSVGSDLSTGLEGTEEVVERKDECRDFYFSTAGGALSGPELDMVVNEAELGRKMLKLFRRRRSAIAVAEQLARPCDEGVSKVSMDHCIEQLSVAVASRLGQAPGYSHWRALEEQL